MRKIIAYRHGFRVTLLKGKNHRSRLAANIQNTWHRLSTKIGSIDQEIPCIVFILPGMHPDEGIVKMGENIVILASSCSKSRHAKHLLHGIIPG
ncbi:MAG: hypothetical protein WCG31_01590 [Deltaproteobacteria bacterium]